MAEYVQLSDVDATTIQEAILKLVASYNNLPVTSKNVQWNNIPSEAGIGLFALQGAIYKTRYISGSYVGLFPFRIVYKCAPTSNKARITSEQVVNQLTDYLKGYSGVLKGNTRINIQAFTKTSPTYKAEANNSGYEEYTCTMQVEYFYK